MNGYIRNIVFGCPDPRLLASFYAPLLGMRLIREDWIVIAADDSSFPRLAFGDGPSEYRPPRWPNPEYPQQIHLDLSVNNLPGTEELALRLGATPLQDRGRYRSYADPAGHPFCLYEREETSEEDGAAVPARIWRVVIDCFSPRSLAAFYDQLLSMPRRQGDSQDWVEIAREDGGLPELAFQQAEFPAPRWPNPEYPQQLHLDLHFDDGSTAQQKALRLGAIRLPKGGSCPVYADPAGHPFCLCSPGQ